MSAMQADTTTADGRSGAIAYRVLEGGAPGPSVPIAQRLDHYFGVSARGSTVASEIRAGCIAWMTMSYIMVVNPMILSNASTPGNLLPPQSVMTGTALAAAFGSLVAGFLGDAPLGLMPGMGLNAYFAFGLCATFGVSWQEALSCCFVSGALLTALAVFGVCHFVVSVLLSEHLKKAITVAIGVFQALIGFQVMGLVVGSPDTLVTLGDMSLSNERLYLALAGFCAISAMLASGGVPGAMLVGIWLMAFCAWATGLAPPPAGIVALPEFGATLSISFDAWAPGSGKLTGMVVGTLVFLFVALFDLAGVQYGLMGIAGLLKDGAVPRSTSIFASAGLATMVGSLLGTSPVIIANESSAGIVEGARTGLMAVTVAVLFALSAFIGPLLSAVPQVATAVPLVLIGAFMMSPCRGIDWDNLRVAIPSFLTMTVVPFTYSIHTGIIAGILMDGFLMVCARPAKEEESETRIFSPSKAPPSRQITVEMRIATPHGPMSCGSASSAKLESARQLLHTLRPHATNADPSGADRDEVLRKAVEAYIESY